MRMARTWDAPQLLQSKAHSLSHRQSCIINSALLTDLEPYLHRQRKDTGKVYQQGYQANLQEVNISQSSNLTSRS